MSSASLAEPTAPESEARPITDDPKVRAQQLVDDAFKALEAGQRDHALARFREAHAVYPSERILLNIGSVLLELGRHGEAANAYHRYLATEGKLRERVAAELRRLETKVARLVIETSESGASLVVDAHAVPPAGEAGPAVVYVDPGRHVVEAIAGERRARVELVAEAAKKHEVRVVFDEPDVPRSATTPMPAGSIPPGARGEARVDRTGSSRGRALRIAGLTTASAGLITLGVATYFGFRARSLERDLEGLEGGWTEDALAKIDEGERAERIMGISIAAGSALLVTGAALYWYGWRSQSQTRAALVLPRRTGIVIGLQGAL